MSENERGIVVHGENNFYLAPAAEIDTILRAYQAKHDIIEKVLRADLDYGSIPGSTKPALLKPGAEKLANMFGLSPRFEDVVTVEDWTGAEHNGEPFFYYRQKCLLYRADRLMGSADGSCNSWEKKYRYREGQRLCPECGQPAVFKSKPPKHGYYCWSKKGGCGAQFAENDKRITEQETGKIPNPDIAEQVNTILKMAQKRALVAATLIVTGASDYFTQDVDDFVAEGSWTPQTDAAENNTFTQEPEFDERGMVDTAASLGATVTEIAADEPLAYTAPVVRIGKNKYPAAWGRPFATFTRVNAFEVDGILQKLKLAQNTSADEALAAVNRYLDAKNGGAA